MNDRIHQLLRRAVECCELASDWQQQELNRRAAGAIPAGQVGQLLKISRSVDTLERCARDLAGLLDQPPGLDRARPVRVLPRPEGPDRDAA